MTVNEKIVELLDWRGVSQGELAQRAGIPKSTINAYLVGRTAVSVDVAYKIAAALGVTPWTLLNGEPLPVSPLDLDKEEQEHIADLRSLTEEQREIVRHTIALMKKQNNKK